MADSSKTPEEFNFEQLTKRLTDETIGIEGLLKKELEELLKDFDVSKNPLSIEQTKQILYSLIRLAVSQRRLLAGRVAQSIGQGDMFKQYKEKMKEIDKLTVETQTKLKKMQMARKQYEYHYHIYEVVTGNTYIDKSEPDSSKQSEVWTEFGKETSGGETKDKVDEENKTKNAQTSNEDSSQSSDESKEENRSNE
jgi:hypothetical protein